MFEFTDPPPEEVLADLARLRFVLDEDVPAKALDRNLLIEQPGTYGPSGTSPRSGNLPRRTRPSATCTPYSA